MAGALPRRLPGEVVGTAFLVFFGAGSVVAALTIGNGRLDYPGLGMIATTFGLAIAVAIYAFGTTSAAHINRDAPRRLGPRSEGSSARRAGSPRGAGEKSGERGERDG